MFRFFVENSHSKYCCASLKGFRNFDETGIIFDREKEVVLSAKTHLSYDYDLKRKNMSRDQSSENCSYVSSVC